MARTLPVETEKDSTIAFFFLFLYTISVLIRPHEMLSISVEWITVKIFAIFAFASVLAAQRPLKIYPQQWMLTLLLPLIVFSGFLNGSGMLGVEQAQKLITSSIIPLFLFTTCITTLKRQHWLMAICIIAALCMVYNGHVQQVNIRGWALNTFALVAHNGDIRITYLGFFNDPNDIGMFLVMNIPFVFYFYNKGKFPTKLLMLSILAAIGYGIYLTGSRGTLLGAGALLGVYYLVVNAGPKLFITAAALAPIAAVTLTSLQSNIDESASQRLEAWYDGILMLVANPIFGVGKGEFIERHGRVAHNSYIQIAAELGVPGYSLWGGALVFTVLTGYLLVKVKKQKDKDKEELSIECQNELTMNKTLFFSMMGFMITAFFITRTYTLTLFIFVGMTLASHIRLAKIMPEFEQYFNKNLALRSMLYGWVLIIAVYMALKVGL
ncbi:MAG: O-antigen ligase family protein [Colwellia sp.]|nr:O-antigen ligase family protein [Colwellia sp.]